MIIIRTIFKAVLGGGAGSFLLAAALIGVLVLAYGKGRTDQSQRCEADKLRTELVHLQNDLDRLKKQAEIADKVRQEFSEQLLNDIKELDIAKSEAEEFSNDVQSRSIKCSPISSDDAARLLKIR